MRLRPGGLRDAASGRLAFGGASRPQSFIDRPKPSPERDRILRMGSRLLRRPARSVPSVIPDE
jgi:hypothetical protein